MKENLITSPIQRSISRIIVASLGLATFVTHANGARIIALGELPGGIFQSVGGAVSDDGLVVAGRDHTALGYEAFRWMDKNILNFIWCVSCVFPGFAGVFSCVGVGVFDVSRTDFRAPSIWSIVAPASNVAVK